jgi:hypothetical protein
VRSFFNSIAVPLSFPFNPNAPHTQFDPFPAGHPKKHATKTAIEGLRHVDIRDVPAEERRCHICMQDFVVDGPRSPYVETVQDQDDVPQPSDDGLTAMHIDVDEQTAGKDGFEEEAEFPLAMPCGHVFGSTCLKEWLHESPTCPLCRVEVESYSDEPDPVHTINFLPFLAEFNPHDPNPFFANEPPFPQPVNEPQQPREQTPAEPSQSAEQSDEQGQAGEHHHRHFHFIFVGPPPPPASQQPPPPPLQRPPMPPPRPASRLHRHHPYARTTTPLPPPIPFPSPPSITERPDLFCAQRGVGLCPHDHNEDTGLLRLECGHAFHQDCLEGSMAVEGYPLVSQDERRCPRCRRWRRVLQ